MDSSTDRLDDCPACGKPKIRATDGDWACSGTDCVYTQGARAARAWHSNQFDYDEPDEKYAALVRYEAMCIGIVLEPPYDDLARGALHTEDERCPVCDAYRLLAKDPSSGEVIDDGRPSHTQQDADAPRVARR